MGYVVVVFAIINSAALIALALIVAWIYRELPMYVSTAIQDEVRKQDDRIEKRVAKAAESSGTVQGPGDLATTNVRDGVIRAGVSVRR